MAIYQGDIGIHDIKLGNIDVFEIYQGSKLVYPENTEVTITFKLNVSGTVTINGYTPVISENNTKFVFTIPVKTNYTANITAEHYKSQTISGNSGYLPITHNVELEWEQRFISYTVTFPTDGVKVLFDGIEKGVITNGKLIVLIDDTEAKDSYTVTFKGSKASIYDTSTLTVVDSSIANTGGSYDLKLPTSSVKTGYKRTDYASSTGSITKGSTYAGTWIETVVNLTASFTSSTTLGSINNNVLTIPNNESTNTKSGTLTVIFTLENKQTKEVSAALNQAAGAKVYTDWVLDLQTDGTSVEAKGGTRTITANVARRTYKWNNTGTVYSETATPTLSISGSASLSGNQIKFTSNESVSARSATLTASYVGLSKTVTITQQAGAKVYSAWSAWTVSISASTQTIAASGGSSTITTNASRSRTWTWNGVGTTHTDTETATPTLSGSAGGFTLSSKTVTASNNTTTNSRSITITATSNSVSKSITITQSAGAKVYGNWSSWSVSCSASSYKVWAGGDSVTIYSSASRNRTWTWNGVAGSGGTESDSATPTISVTSGVGVLSGNTLTFSNNTSPDARTTRVTANYNGVTDYCDVMQYGGNKVTGSWTSWQVTISASPMNIAASGGSSTILCHASRTRNYTWNGVGTTYTETENGSPTLSKSGDGTLSGTTSGSKLTYGNRTTTTSRSTTVTATYNGVSKSINITQSAGSKVTGKMTYHTDIYDRNSSNYTDYTSYPVTHDIGGEPVISGGDTIITYCRLRKTQPWTWNGVSGSGGTDTTYASAKDVAIVSQSNCTTTVKDTGSNNIIMFSSVVPANLSSSARTWYFNWRWLGSNNTTIRNTQAANTLRGRLVIKNDYFTSQNVALPIYLDSQNVDSIYKGEASYNDIKKTPISVYVYIPTNVAIMNAGKLQFWFENKDGGGSKYTCTLSSVSTPMNNVSVSNSNNIISVTANTTTSSFTILCQFTMTSNSTLFNVRVLIEP